MTIMIEKHAPLTLDQKRAIEAKLIEYRDRKAVNFDTIDAALAEQFSVGEWQIAHARLRIGYDKYSILRKKKECVKDLLRDNPGISNEDINEILAGKFGAGMGGAGLHEVRNSVKRSMPKVPTVSKKGQAVVTVHGAAQLAKTTPENIRDAVRRGRLKPDMSIDGAQGFYVSTIETWRKSVEAYKERAVKNLSGSTRDAEIAKLAKEIRDLKEAVKLLVKPGNGTDEKPSEIVPAPKPWQIDRDA